MARKLRVEYLLFGAVVSIAALLMVMLRGILIPKGLNPAAASHLP